MTEILIKSIYYSIICNPAQIAQFTPHTFFSLDMKKTIEFGRPKGLYCNDANDNFLQSIS